jgi:hypothetical protein
MKVPKIDASIGITGAYAATKIGPRLWIDQHFNTLFMPDIIKPCNSIPDFHLGKFCQTVSVKSNSVVKTLEPHMVSYQLLVHPFVTEEFY